MQKREPTHCCGRVIWSADRRVRKRFSATADVVQAGWARFAEGGRVLCMLQASELTTVAEGGQVHDLPLAATYSQLWSLPAGILLTVRRLPAASPRATPVDGSAADNMLGTLMRCCCCAGRGWGSPRGADASFGGLAAGGRSAGGTCKLACIVVRRGDGDLEQHGRPLPCYLQRGSKLSLAMRSGQNLPQYPNKQ